MPPHQRHMNGVSLELSSRNMIGGRTDVASEEVGAGKERSDLAGQIQRSGINSRRISNDSEQHQRFLLKLNQCLQTTCCRPWAYDTLPKWESHITCSSCPGQLPPTIVWYFVAFCLQNMGRNCSSPFIERLGYLEILPPTKGDGTLTPRNGMVAWKVQSLH